MITLTTVNNNRDSLCLHPVAGETAYHFSIHRTGRVRREKREKGSELWLRLRYRRPRDEENGLLGEMNLKR